MNEVTLYNQLTNQFPPAGISGFPLQCENLFQFNDINMEDGNYAHRATQVHRLFSNGGRALFKYINNFYYNILLYTDVITVKTRHNYPEPAQHYLPVQLLFQLGKL